MVQWYYIKVDGSILQPPSHDSISNLFEWIKQATPKAFLNILKMNKANIFHANHVPKSLTGQYHALTLYLLAMMGIIGLEATDTTKV